MKEPIVNKRPGLLVVLLLTLFLFVSACGNIASTGSSANAVPSSFTLVYQPGLGAVTFVILKTQKIIDKQFPNTKIQWKIVNSGASVREAIQGLLKSVNLRSEAFGTAQEFLRSKRPDGPSCLVLDIRLPGINGLEFQRELADTGAQIPIIFITGHGDIPMTV